MVNSPRSSDSRTWLRTLIDFHEDESGDQTMQTVMLLGAAALVLGFLILFFTKFVKPWFMKAWYGIDSEGNQIKDTSGGQTQ